MPGWTKGIGYQLDAGGTAWLIDGYLRYGPRVYRVTLEWCREATPAELDTEFGHLGWRHPLRKH